jgi:hypothetical protein
MSDTMLKSSKNIKFCAYLRYRKFYPKDINVFSRGKAEYFYEIGATEWEMLKLEFDKSDFIDYADCLDKIKDLAY